MTVFLMALLLISLVSLGILFWSKHVEAKTGQAFFLPVVLHNHDKEIEERTRQAAKNFVAVAHQTMRTVWPLARRNFKRVWVRVRKIRASRFKQPIESNGGGSVYLKQMMEHKNNIRNGNDHS